MEQHLSALVFLTLLFASTSQAQISPPNESGVSMGHLEFVVKDVDASNDFWVKVGGIPAKLGSMLVVKFPGVIIRFRQGEPAGGTEGSTINHVGFSVPNVEAAMAKWKAAGLNVLPGRVSHGECYILTPDALTKVEILEDSLLKVPIAFQQIHFYLAETGPNPGTTAEIEDWYVKMFGARHSTFLTAEGKPRPGAADLPGVSLRFAKSQTPTVSIKGRTLDQIGFEVQNLKAFCKKAKAKGLKFDLLCEKRSGLGISRACLTDPWGTPIELTEGLNRL